MRATTLSEKKPRNFQKKSKQVIGRRERKRAENRARIMEWKSRKANHVEDPMPAARELQRGKSAPHGNVVAKCGSTVVARTSELKVASGRNYFPFAHCDLRHFEPSGKRWR